MQVSCFVLCGATCTEATQYEADWGVAAVDANIAIEYSVFAAPSGVLGKGWDNWWCRYEPKDGERFDDTLNGPTYLEDIEATVEASGLKAAIQAAQDEGNRVAFIGASNGGHVAVNLGIQHNAAWILLASSAPLEQRKQLCRSHRIPLVMTVCEWETYFGGWQGLCSAAAMEDAYYVWVAQAKHCKEDQWHQQRATLAVKRWIGGF